MAVKYPPPSPPFIPARHKGRPGSNKPRAIVIHGAVTSDNPGTARNVANWWASSGSPVTSAHYTVDPREVIQSVGDHAVAYHCGSNQDTIGVELCDEQQGPASRWKDADSTAIIRRAARLVAELCLAYGIEARRPTIAELRSGGKHGIYGHNDSRLAFGGTSHTDPRDFDWDEFIRLVRLEIANIQRAHGETPAPTPKPTVPKMVKARPTLRLGSRGVDVRRLQKLLGIEADGVFGRITQVNVIRFQRQSGLKVDGVVGPATWKALLATRKKQVVPPVVPSAWDKAERVHVQHISGQFNDTDKQHLDDARAIFARAKARKVAWITGTEGGTGAGNWPAALKQEARVHGYHIYQPGGASDWIAVAKSFAPGGIKGYLGPVVIPGKAGAHSHKRVVAVEFRNPALGDIHVIAGHYLTKGRPDAKSPEYRVNLAKNRLLAKAISEYAVKVGAGSDLVFYGGDQNIVDRNNDTFFGGPLTSVWDELKMWENTGHGNIDVIASYDRDARVKAGYIRALDDKEWFLHTDHFAVEAGFDILPKRKV